MKKVILLFATVLFAQSISAQGTIDLSITQDVKLSFMKDGHGNIPFTTDVRFDLFLNGGINGDETNWGFVGLTFEFANLYGGDFYRWGLIGGWSFKSGINIPSLEIAFNTKIEPYIGLSVINRELTGNIGNLSFEAGMNIAFEINDWFEIISKTNLIQRGDLERFGDKASSFEPWKWQPQFGIGGRFILF